MDASVSAMKCVADAGWAAHDTFRTHPGVEFVRGDRRP
jgi:hypothetical protein